MSRQWSEKELEEYVCTHLDEFAGSIYPTDVEIDGVPWFPSIRLLGRQVRTTAGVIDALFICEGQLYIVEFKAVTATQKDLGQLQRYRSVLNYSSIHGYLVNRAVDKELYEFVLIRLGESIKVVLVAPDFTREAWLGADFCIRATRDENGFWFEESSSMGEHLWKNTQLSELMGQYIEVLIEEYQHYREQMSDDILQTHAEESASYRN